MFIFNRLYITPVFILWNFYILRTFFTVPWLGIFSLFICMCRITGLNLFRESHQHSLTISSFLFLFDTVVLSLFMPSNKSVQFSWTKLVCKPKFLFFFSIPWFYLGYVVLFCQSLSYYFALRLKSNSANWYIRLPLKNGALSFLKRRLRHL